MKNIALNNDFSERCVVDSLALPWQPSPSPKVHRRLLERDGGEIARATSIVRYDAGARFESHLHELGEEILVLDGTLGDEFGSYGPGTYLKNPPGSRHRTAISNERIRAVNENEVAFNVRSDDKGSKRLMRLPGEEFVRRFMLHVLPTGVKRIRHYGVLAASCKKVKMGAARLAICHPKTLAFNPYCAKSTR